MLLACSQGFVMHLYQSKNKIKPMKTLFTLLSLLVAAGASAQQTTAMDFQRNDCYGTPHHLFSTLDSNYVVILEYAMDCSSCINAAHKLETMMNGINAQYPGKVRMYEFAYTNNYSCNTMINFVQDNNINALPFDSGATQTAYYGGFGMPTVVVVAGTSHQVLTTHIGFSTSDTSEIGDAIRGFLQSLNVNQQQKAAASFDVFPNPASDLTTYELALTQNALVDVDLFDVTGKKVASIYHGTAAETLTNAIDLTNYSPGIYLLRAIANGDVMYTKVNILR
jgi:hypothetical protein